MIKKILIGLGIVVVLVLGVVISLPFWIDMNAFKGKITETINHNIEGTFQVSSVSLRGLTIQAHKMSLESKDTFKHREILFVEDVRVKVSLFSLLMFHPRVTLELLSPKIDLVKNQQGKLNVMSLVKTAPKPDVVVQKSSKDSKTQRVLPAFLINAKVTLAVEQAQVQYIDEGTGSKTVIRDLNVKLKNVSLNDPIDFDVAAVVAGGANAPAFFQGLVKAKGTAEVQTSAQKRIEKIQLNSQVGLGALEISLKGSISDLETLQANLEVSTPSVSLAELRKSFGFLHPFAIQGTFEMAGKVKGPLKKYDVCTVDLQSHLKLAMKETQLELTTNVSEVLNHLKATISLNANKVDLDELLSGPKMALGGWIWMPVAVAAPVVSQQKDLLGNFRNNEILRGLKASGRIAIQKLYFKKALFSKIDGQFELNQLTLVLSKLNLEAFKGTLQNSGKVDLAGEQPTYDFSTEIKTFELNEMLTMANPLLLKDVLIGKLDGDLKISGRGLLWPEMKRTLKGQGKIAVQEAELKGLNIGKTLQEQLKILAIFSESDILKEKLDGKINFIRSTLFIKEGKLYTPDAFLDTPQYQATLNGYATFDKEIRYSGEVLLPKEKLSRSLASLANAQGKVGFPFLLSGTLPQFSFQVDVNKVAQRAAKQSLTKKVQEKVKEKLGIDLPVELPF
ncbi:MAG: AsmA family protein [Deltaproteobacteria bacterium]|nr:AsmA family protein [Deltaproteobacteria bacterium]